MIRGWLYLNSDMRNWMLILIWFDLIKDRNGLTEAGIVCSVNWQSPVFSQPTHWCTGLQTSPAAEPRLHCTQCVYVLIWSMSVFGSSNNLVDASIQSELWGFHMTRVALRIKGRCQTRTKLKTIWPLSAGVCRFSFTVSCIRHAAELSAYMKHNGLMRSKVLWCW